MRFFENLCEALTRALGLSALSPWSQQTEDQRPFVVDKIQSNANDDFAVVETSAPSILIAESATATGLPDGPRFKPPNAGDNFYCDYTKMKGWRHTANSGSRTSWLEKPISADDPTGGIYDILTDYDEYWPEGTIRKVQDMSLL